MKEEIKKIGGSLYYFSGAKFSVRKFVPEDKKALPTGFIWLIGIYIALFGVASNRYENRIDIIENRANAIFAQLATNNYDKALSRISTVQTMECPVEPNILNPITVIGSFFKNTKYDEMVILLKNTLEDWKHELDYKKIWLADLVGADLTTANLTGAYLMSADFLGANLSGANLKRAMLNEANFQLANLEGVNFQLANLEGVNFQEAELFGANLMNATVKDTNFQQASLVGTNLKGSKELTIQQLCGAYSLWKAQLDQKIYDEVKEKCPRLLKRPKGKGYRKKMK
jgi:uncharacterized protein YjbI with pentapeptide repeats